jgi:hypothetical protein
MTEAIQVAPAAPIQHYEPPSELSIDDIVKRVEKVKEVSKRVMQDGHHFGLIPGVKKPSLLKPGAEILCLTFRLGPEFDIHEADLGDGHREYRVKCTLVHTPTGTRVGDGHGSCSTRESKYAWRQGERRCPKCAKPTIIKGKAEYGGGWLCFGKKGGCGAKFQDGDRAIEGQSTGRVANEDIADVYNTVLKMACKRALVAAVLIVTCASDLFTQDVEDMGQFAAEPEQGNGTRVSPHEYPDEAPPARAQQPNKLLAELLQRLTELESDIAQCATYEAALALREQLGSKAKASELTARIQQGRESGELNSAHSKTLGATWQRCDRQLAKKLQELTPDAADSFTDDSADPNNDGR